MLQLANNSIFRIKVCCDTTAVQECVPDSVVEFLTEYVKPPLSWL